MTLGLLIRDGANVQREISELFIRDATNTPREITELWVRDVNNVPRLVFNPSGSASLSVEVMPPGATGFSFGTGTATTNTVTATATGGVPPYTYAWTLDSFSSIFAAPTANSPASGTTDFTQTSMEPNSIEISTWTVTATDDDGAIATTQINANFTDVS